MNESVDKSLQESFLDEYLESKSRIKQSLLQLEEDPADVEAARALFRDVHSVKSNLHMVGLPSVGKLIHNLENILDAVRKGQRQFSQLLCDFILLLFEAVERLFKSAFDDEDIQVEMVIYEKAMEDMSPMDTSDGVVLDAIRVFDPDYSYDAPQSNQDIADDQILFLNLANAMEQRLIGKQGSTQRIVDTALAMNRIAGNPVHMEQLQAAATMHDVAMGFLPLSLLNKKESYTNMERQKLHSHPNMAAELLLSLEQWQEASEMVIQHHERVDGKGYPNQLTGDQICPGAKILAIADTFESMSHLRADREHRRTIIRIVAEVNANIGEQFDEYWVDIFNQFVRQQHLQKK